MDATTCPVERLPPDSGRSYDFVQIWKQTQLEGPECIEGADDLVMAVP